MINKLNLKYGLKKKKKKTRRRNSSSALFMWERTRLVAYSAVSCTDCSSCLASYLNRSYDYSAAVILWDALKLATLPFLLILRGDSSFTYVLS